MADKKMYKISTGFALTVVAVAAAFVIIIINVDNGPSVSFGNEKLASKKMKINAGKNTDDRLDGTIGRKIVALSDGEARLSFEIPDDWAAETRNSGEKKMSDEEILDFLKTNINSKGQNYSDMTDEELSKLTHEDLDREIRDFPNATVARISENGGIDYSDWNPDQIDINFLTDQAAENEKEGIEEDAKNFLANNPYQRTFKWIWSMENVGGYDAETVTFPLGLDSAGQNNATVELTGGKIYFISIGETGKTLVIKKQGKGDEQFEKDFGHLIDSLKFGMSTSA